MTTNYTNKELYDMIIVFGKCDEQSRKAARLYARKYPDRRKPHHLFFARLAARLESNAQLRPIKRAGRLPQIDTAPIQEMVINDPTISTRAIAQYQGVSQTTVCKALKSAHFHPYKAVLTQELYINDETRRLRYCQWFLNESEKNYYFSKYILFSDECTFHNDGNVNRHNLHYWATENPHWVLQAHSQVKWSVNVWAGILGDHIIGPYFIDGKVDGNFYRNFLRNKLVNLLDEVPLESRVNMWFQQDGHPAHTAKETRLLLNEKFGRRWIGLHGPHEWPPRSPDLTPLDFYLWGHLKQQVYATRPASIEDLKDRIVRACRAITPQILCRVREAILDRAILCERMEGSHFEHILK